MRRSIPIRCPAASIVELVRSIPCTARSSTDCSLSSELWKLCDDALSWLASDSSESVRSSCSSRWSLSACSVLSSFSLSVGATRLPVAFALGAAGAPVAPRLRSVDVGAALGVAVGADAGAVAVAVAGADAAGPLASFASASCPCSTTCGSPCPPALETTFSSAMGLASISAHSPSASSVSGSVSCARTSSSSRRVCIRFNSCLSRAISDCASCRRSRGFNCGSERSSWERRVRAYSTFYRSLVRYCSHIQS